MLDIQRSKGQTTITAGSMVIRSDKINRYRFNDIRKQIEKLNKLIGFALWQGKRK